MSAYNGTVHSGVKPHLPGRASLERSYMFAIGTAPHKPPIHTASSLSENGPLFAGAAVHSASSSSVSSQHQRRTKLRTNPKLSANPVPLVASSAGLCEVLSVGAEADSEPESSAEAEENSALSDSDNAIIQSRKSEKRTKRRHGFDTIADRLLCASPETSSDECLSFTQQGKRGTIMEKKS